MKTFVFILLSFFCMESLWSQDGFNGAAIERTQGSGEYDTRGWAINYMARHSAMTVYAGYQWLRFDPVNEILSTDERINLDGFHAGLNFHPKFRYVRPFVGFGTFIGDRRQCPDSTTDCNRNGVFAIYPEAGIEFSLGEAVKVTARARWYEFDEATLRDDRLVSVSLAYYLE